MLHNGPNEVDGIPVEVIRKRIRRINIRVAADGTVCLSVPKWWATLRQGEEFLREKWRWVKKVRGEVLARPAVTRAPRIAPPAGQPSAGGYPAAPVTQSGAKGRKLTLVQTEFLG